MEFTHVEHTKYNTTSIYIKNAGIELDDCKILNVEDTEYNYQKVQVKLSEEKIDKMNEIESKVNEHLDSKGHNRITLVYGTCIYAKKYINKPTDKLKHIKLKSIYLNNGSIPQLWVV